MVTVGRGQGFDKFIIRYRKRKVNFLYTLSISVILPYLTEAEPMTACKKCNEQLISMVLESDEEKETISYRCANCGDFFIEEREIESSPASKEPATAVPPRTESVDKHIKVHRDVWEMANEFVREHKIMYPSIKFFTQQAIMEKIKRGK